MQFKDVSRGKWLRKKYLEYIVMASFYYFLIGESGFRLMTHRTAILDYLLCGILCSWLVLDFDCVLDTRPVNMYDVLNLLVLACTLVPRRVMFWQTISRGSPASVWRHGRW